MAFREYDQYDATGLAALVRQRQVTPQELLDAAIERVEARDGTINAVVTKMYDQARGSIAAGLPNGPFEGVPFMLKDLGVLYAGVRTSNGSRIFADFVPDHDSTLVERYKAAGLVIMGKTNTPELGVAATTEPLLFGPTRNPWSLTHSAGGSSGGAAAAVAAGYLPMAHATDGGGSIRIPASMCGLFGLKPSRARNPAGPDLGEGLAGMATGHCVSRSVRDSAALLDATHGPAVGDPYAAPPLARPLLDEVGAAPGRLRIAMCTTDYLGNPIHPECAAAVQAAARLCASLGHDIEEARPDFSGLPLSRAWRVIPAANLWLNVSARARALGRDPLPGDVEPLTWAWMQEGRRLTAADYLETVSIMHGLGRRLGAFLERYDLLLTATLARPPLALGEMRMTSDDVDRYVAFLFDEVAPLTPLFNQTGGAAMSVPLAWSSEGLPLGVQFGGGLGDEPTLIRLAAQLEQAQPWANRRPANGE
ncbi:MAG: amidase [Candidatus Tectomicrobia bacterium]|uniref:Amidase n=1 Tax=Tectimicrobiota bacterium TaxID=2528274 RepID=A0A937VX97_UNCTE|nr:amidase [Candidatus Tectomicrobia bacterium]